MISILMVSREKDTFAGIIEPFAKADFKIYWASSGANTFSLLSEKTIDLVIVDENISDMTGRQFIEKVVMENPIINCVVSSSLGHKEFHETYEGLGVLMQFSVKPDKTEVQSLIEHMNLIFNLQKKAKKIAEE
jgi:two-component SAPR family response regulator